MVSIINNYKHWDYYLDEHNILWLGFDRNGKSVNSLSCESIAELSEIVGCIANNKLKDIDNKIKSLIIYSRKDSGFIAGADVTEFKGISESSKARSILENGQNAMNEIAKLNITTVAMIDGFCLGGGFELALTCDYRIASDDLSTKIGLPEIMLGIIPGWGGTVRLPKLIGGNKALPLIMQGRAVSSKAAVKLGMIDACVPKRQLKKTAAFFAKSKSKKYQSKWMSVLTNSYPFRKAFAHFAEKQLKAKISKEHYPAPYAVLNNWLSNGVDGDSPYRAEVNTNLDIIKKPTASNLMRVFFVQEKLKDEAKKVKPDVKHVHVIGGGTMGGDIAAWCAFKGYKVTLQDRTSADLSKALGRAYKLFKKKLKKPDLAKLALDKLIPDVNGHGIKSADVIIEAVFEDLKVKQDLFKDIEQKAKPDAILATNTSSILLDDISEALNNKSRLVGIHFFNPVPQMQLVEIVKGKQTDDSICDKAAAFVAKLGKLPVPVASSPGFLVNRVLAAYMHETFIMLEEGIKPEVIDKSMKKFGMPMGPVEMVDVVGLDICLSVAQNVCAHAGESIPSIIENMVAKKHLGKKTKKGFYDYKNNKIVRNEIEGSPNFDEITERLTMRILNSCVSCIREHVVSDEVHVDAGLIFGAGFAPFRGGPMNYLRHLGKDTVQKKLESLENKFGDRFKPDQGFNLLDKKNTDEHAAQACG